MASSQRLRRGVASDPRRPGVGVASQRLAPPGVASERPGVAPESSTRPGVASQRPSAGVASASSHAVRAFFLQPLERYQLQVAGFQGAAFLRSGTTQSAPTLTAAHCAEVISLSGRIRSDQI